MEDNNERYDVPAIADSTLIAIAEQAEKRIEAVNKIKRIALRVTNPYDWTNQQDRPYLQVSGAEKIARLFGISWQIDEPVFEADEGGHFSYTYKGSFSFAGVRIEAIGTRSSRDPFFTRYGKERDEQGNRVALPPSEIDKGDLKKAAYTNCIGNGITRLLGIRNLTWDDLLQANIRKDSVGRVEYKTAGKDNGGGTTGTISEAQAGRFYTIAKKAGKADTDIKDYLKTLNVESAKDIPRSKYEEACKWAESAMRQPGEDG